MEVTTTLNAASDIQTTYFSPSRVVQKLNITYSDNHQFPIPMLQEETFKRMRKSFSIQLSFSLSTVGSHMYIIINVQWNQLNCLTSYSPRMEMAKVICPSVDLLQFIWLFAYAHWAPPNTWILVMTSPLECRLHKNIQNVDCQVHDNTCGFKKR